MSVCQVGSSLWLRTHDHEHKQREKKEGGGKPNPDVIIVADQEIFLGKLFLVGRFLAVQHVWMIHDLGATRNATMQRDPKKDQGKKRISDLVVDV